MMTEMFDEFYFRAAEEDRCAPRMPVNLPALVRRVGKTPFSTTIRDISLAGLCCDAVIPTSGSPRVWVTLPTLAPLEADVVWNNGALIGCAFTTLLNPAVLDWLLTQHRRGTLPRPGAIAPRAISPTKRSVCC